MRTQFKTLAIACLATVTFASCTKEVKEPTQEEISDGTLAQIKALGFGTKDVQKHEEGFLVEGDIVLTQDYLNSKSDYTLMRIANVEQYRTTNLVSGTRNISLALDSKIASKAGYKQALQEVANRYNALNLNLTFSVVTSGANVTFSNANGSYLASAGFPSGGNPYNSVKVNTRAIGTGTSTTFINYLATILAHELGHCIGFRHTDYMDRSYSCGGSTANEGASTVGAIHIPGTPTAADPNSWMLACIGTGQNRPFNANDRTALTYIY